LLNTKNAVNRLWAVGVGTAKDDLAAWLHILPDPDEPTHHAVHFPIEGLPVGQSEQLTAEEVVTELKAEGCKVWRRR
jgi:phage terminase large subunit GpA-like protein